MHQAQMDFCKRVKSKHPKYFDNCNVLDIGSMDINGNNRYLFTNYEYIGIDLSEGKNVDIVVPKGAHTANIKGVFDVVISTECFEHDRHYLKTINKMIEWCDGLMLFTCATTGRREHGTKTMNPNSSPFTNDYYKNLTVEDININFDDYFSSYEFEINRASNDLYFWGIKK